MKTLAYTLGTCLLIMGAQACTASSSDEENNAEYNSDTDLQTNNGDSDDNAGLGSITGYGLALEAGVQWTFYWSYYNHTNWTASGYGMNPSTKTNDGYVTITLGAATTIAGKSLHEVELSGDIPGTSSSSWSEYFWKYIGVDQGSLIASEDGFSVETIVDGEQGTTSYSFFMRQYPASTPLSNSSFTAEDDAPISYTTDAHKGAYSYSEDDSISIPGIYLEGDEAALSFSDFYKAGIGPIGHRYYHFWKDIEGAGEWSSGTTEWDFTLVSSSLDADDGFAPPLPVWEVYGEMPEERESPNVVVVDGTPYLLGGDVLYEPVLSVRKLESDGSWTSCASVPVPWTTAGSSTGACVLNGKIYLAMKYNLGMSREMRLYSYDPGTDSWSLAATGSSQTDVSDCFTWGDSIYIVGKNGVHYLYEQGVENLEYAVDALVSTGSLTYISALSHADSNIFIVGQYNNYGDNYTTGMWTIDDNSTYSADSVWAGSDYHRRWAPGLAVYNNRLYIFGGGEDEIAKKVISCEIGANGTVSDWQTHSSMLYGGTKLDAVVVDNKIYVYGCDDGKKIELYNPQNE